MKSASNACSCPCTTARRVLVRARGLSERRSLARLIRASLCTLGLFFYASFAAAQSSTPVNAIPAPAPAVEPATCPPPDGTRPDPTLVNTDDFVLERFSFERVLSQLTRLAKVRQRSSDLYQQMWDSMDTNANAKLSGPHCDDLSPASINGFPIDCPRPEASLKDSQPATFVPVALTNRFDLAPADGLNCGEYRIVYAMKPFSENNRNFIILEGLLPNPKPSCGLEACRPIVDFWQSLAQYDVSRRADRNALADRLESFYFRGLPGFGPVMEPTHLGMSGRGGAQGRNGGQIRTNMFINGETSTWQLREFRLLRECTGRSCRLVFNPVAVGTNPFPPLFDSSFPDPLVPEFQNDFISQVESLSNDDVNLISMKIDDRYNAGQSTSTGFNDTYLVQSIIGYSNGAHSMVDALQAEIARIGRSDNLDAFDITSRATTQSCAGCHQSAAGAPLGFFGGGGPLWPSPRPDGFVHIDENSFLSPALWCTFLPFRKSVLDAFSASPPRRCSSCFTFVKPKHGPNPRGDLREFTVSGKRFGAN